MKTNFLNLQATIGGMAARSTEGGQTLTAMFDTVSGVLLVMSAKAMPAGAPEMRQRGHAVVTDNGNADDYDALFTEDQIRDAISDYFSFSGRGLLQFDGGAERMNPTSKIEADGVDERGRKYRVAADINNGQVAVLVLCWFAVRQAGFARQLAAFDDYANLDMSVTTVGLDDDAEVRQVVGYAMGGKLPLGADGWPVE